MGTFDNAKFMLSPMAGVTNAPFRLMCRKFAPEDGLFVDEMVADRVMSARLVVAQKYTKFAPAEGFRSSQLYCKEPEYAYKAAAMIAKNDLADHIDLNFGCPVRKVTANGGGSALPWKLGLYREIIHSVIKGTRETANDKHIPVSAKFRIGIDDTHITYIDAGQIAVDEGCELITLHARTAKQYYSGEAHWEYIKNLREITPPEVKVFGNGDIFSGKDAKKMLAETGADGVAIGRGALGKPWIFGELRGETYNPNLGEVIDIMLEHLRIHYEYFDTIANFRVHIGPYLKGFPVGGELKTRLMLAPDYESFAHLLDKLDKNAPYPEVVLGKPRGRTKSTAKVFLPPGWLDTRD